MTAGAGAPPTLIVSEVFGPTFQGEGPSTGRRAGFIRLGRCNLDCSWCDTPYTWDWSGKNGEPQDPAALERWAVEQTVAQVRAMNVPLAIITGGEPLLQRRALDRLVPDLLNYGHDVEIETNGTLPPTETLALLAGAGPGVNRRLSLNVSPKLANSGVSEAARYRPDVLAALARIGARFKFVVTQGSDLDEVDHIVQAAEVQPDRVWIMPEGRDSATITHLLRLLAPTVLDRAYNLSGRLHVQLWGDARGR